MFFMCPAFLDDSLQGIKLPGNGIRINSVVVYTVNNIQHITYYKINITFCFHVAMDKLVKWTLFPPTAENDLVQIHRCRQLVRPKHVKTAEHKPRSSSDQMFVRTLPKHTTEVLYDFAVE